MPHRGVDWTVRMPASIVGLADSFVEEVNGGWLLYWPTVAYYKGHKIDTLWMDEADSVSQSIACHQIETRNRIIKSAHPGVKRSMYISNLVYTKVD